MSMRVLLTAYFLNSEPFAFDEIVCRVMPHFLHVRNMASLYIHKTHTNSPFSSLRSTNQGHCPSIFCRFK
jgi:hypothetical protein